MAPPNQDKASIIRHIQEASSIHIVSHENPDGDSLGAQFAMAIALTSLGKKAYVRCKDPIPKMYDFLPGQEYIKPSKEVEINQDEILLVLDCSSLERTGLILIPHPPPVMINIDHHITNALFGHLNWVDFEASATSELIFQLLNDLGILLTPFIAINLYTGILTDTGSFQYSNTTGKCLKIAGELITAQADPHLISTAVYDRRTLPAMRLMGHALNEMEIHHNQNIAILTVTQEILNTLNATYEDTEDLVIVPQKIESIKVSVLIKELNEGEYKVSFRSKGKTDVAKIAGSFGGGGHPNAAGTKMNGDLAQIKERVLKGIIPFLTSD